MASRLRKWLIRRIPTSLHPTLRSLQYRSTRAVGATLRSLPGTSRRLGPPRQMVRTLAEYVDRRNRVRRGAATYMEIYPAQVVTRSLPRTLEAQIHPEFHREARRLALPAGVGVIGRGRVVTATGTVIAPRDYLILDVSETSLTDDAWAHPVFLRPKLGAVTRVDGAVAVVTTWFSSIYYHWLIDAIPRLHLLERSGLPYDHLVVPMTHRFHRDALALLEIDERKVLGGPEHRHVEAGRLIVPSLPGLIGNAPAWACQYVRSRFLPKAAPGPRRRRLFLSRAKAGTRRLTNEDELLAMLERHGFERVFPEDLPLIEQVRLFAEAEIVVGAHGSGLINLLFCAPGTAVIEIFSPNYMNVMYWALANQLGLDYAYVRGRDGGQYSAARGRRVHEDITADPRQVQGLIEARQHVALASH